MTIFRTENPLIVTAGFIFVTLGIMHFLRDSEIMVATPALPSEKKDTVVEGPLSVQVTSGPALSANPSAVFGTPTKKGRVSSGELCEWDKCDRTDLRTVDTAGTVLVFGSS